jgi:hypothetical protein
VTKYQAVGEYITRVTRFHTDYIENEHVCTVTEAAEAFLHAQRGLAICKKRGDHDYSDKVPQTSNMYLCFRCGEPGWEVPEL